jgi:hypothetical protein
VSIPAPESKIIGTKKLAAAERQLDTAIWLWFNDGDLVSIQTLAGAAHGILDDLLQDRKKGRAIPFETPPKGMEARAWRNLLKEGQTFAKHARKDPRAIEAYDAGQIEIFLFWIILTHARLTDCEWTAHGLRSLFLLRLRFRHPERFSSLPPHVRALESGGERFDIESLKNLSRADFFQKLGGDFVGNPPRPD